MQKVVNRNDARYNCKKGSKDDTNCTGSSVSFSIRWWLFLLRNHQYLACSNCQQSKYESYESLLHIFTFIFVLVAVSVFALYAAYLLLYFNCICICILFVFLFVFMVLQLVWARNLVNISQESALRKWFQCICNCIFF